MDLGVDGGGDAAGLGGDVASEAAEAEGDDDDEGHDADEEEGEGEVDGEEPTAEDDDEEELTGKSEREGGGFGEILGVGGDAADEFADWLLVIEGEVMVDSGVEDIGAELPDDVTDDNGGVTLVDVVGEPAEEAEEGEAEGGENEDEAGGLGDDEIDGVAHEDGDGGAGEGAEDDGDDDERHEAAVGAEVGEDAADEGAIAV